MGGNPDPAQLRRCDRCVRGNGRCLWVLPASHLGLLPAVNNTIRTWVAWVEQTRSGTEEEMINAYNDF